MMSHARSTAHSFCLGFLGDNLGPRMTLWRLEHVGFDRNDSYAEILGFLTDGLGARLDSRRQDAISTGEGLSGQHG